MRRPRILSVLVLTLLAMTIAPADAFARSCFPETNQCLDGRIEQYWAQNGGLMVFGFPITAQAPEVNRDTGQTYPTQWMERNRFELHPENAAPYDVLLGRLGDDRLRQLGLDWQTFPKANPSDPHYFPQTGHAITHEPFWQYWRTHGLELGDRGISERESLALFGYPISPARMETNSSGDTVLTQWFERARFEWHPNNPDPYKVLLGLLGNEIRAHAQTPGPSPEPSPSPSPSPSPAPQPPAKVVLEGSGQRVTDHFVLPARVNRVIAQHTGRRNFIVWAYAPDGNRRLVANEIGTATSMTPLEGTGSWFLEVNADGEWTITIEPIGNDPGAAGAIGGRGTYVSGFFTPPRTGPVPYRFSHTGQRNFIVWLHCEQGNDLVVNEIGNVSGEAVADFRGGPCYWEVDADGDWTLAPR